MGFLFNKKTIKVDLKNKSIRINEFMKIQQVYDLIYKEFNENQELEYYNCPAQIYFEEEEIKLKLMGDWTFDKKTVGIYRQRMDRRYRKIPEASEKSIGYHYKRL